jgi:NAD-dependent DNA ligase
VDVKLLGTGMPSYWSLELQTHRFDLGLSGWTENDWSSAARFDLLAATNEPSKGDVELAANQLEKALKLSPDELAARCDLSRGGATAALQQLCREGRAMFDIASGAYRWRQLLPVPAPEGEEDKKLASAKRWIKENNVKCHPLREVPEFLQRFAEKGARLFEANVKTPGGNFHPTVGLDADGRATFAQCTCSDFKRNKMRQGPCAHILAAAALAGRIESSKAQSADRFKGQTWVFTGALTLFTREQAHQLIENGGGKTADSVSKNTSVLVVGERAGSKLKKAEDLGVKILTEAQFQALLEGRGE